MNFSDLDGDIYKLRIKTTIAALQVMSFEEFLKEHLEIGLSSDELFKNIILDSLLAVEYGIKKKDDELLNYVNFLITKLEEEKLEEEENVPLAKLFAKLLVKAISVCQAGLSVKRTAITFEFYDFAEVFDEKMVKKTVVTRNRKYNRKNFHYSSN